MKYDINRTGKLERQWAEEGFVVKRGRKGCWLRPNIYSREYYLYYDPDEVKEDPEKAAAYLAKLKEQKRKEQQRRRKEAKKRTLSIQKAWKSTLKENPKIVVFDTETSGLDENDNDILSLSWQVVDAKKWQTISKHDFYFDWVGDDRVSYRAIEVNGLTKERLAEIGTVPRSEALSLFASEIKTASLVVAHNGTFDKKFIDATVLREEIDPCPWPPMYDTMHETTYYCKIPCYNYHGDKYKWPKLIELAEKLKIDDSDIDYHQSSADVELTLRCFKKIVQNCILPPNFS